jgi:hypothetical protein
VTPSNATVMLNSGSEDLPRQPPFSPPMPYTQGPWATPGHWHPLQPIFPGSNMCLPLNSEAP